MSTLIILRGNSGSGKSTVAKALQKHFGRNTMLIEQDAIRIDLLRTKDVEGNPAIELMKTIALYGQANCKITIIEGILSSSIYKPMLEQLMQVFDCVHTYYFNIPFEETVRRHATRDKVHVFSAEDMQRWYRPDDYLQTPSEQTIDATSTLEQTIQQIIFAIQTPQM